MKLYDFAGSGNCHKVRMLLSFLDLPWERVPVDVARDETLHPAFLALNPRGQVPVLVDEEILLWDSQAILVYLARRYGEEHWLPLEPVALARVMQWLALAQNELLYGLARARLVLKMGRPWNLTECQSLGQQGLAALEARLAGAPWLASEAISLADVACYPYVALAPEAGVDLHPCPATRRWLARIQALPRYVGMPGMLEVPAEETDAG